MSPEAGFIHPEKLDDSGESVRFRRSHGLLRRSVYPGSPRIYSFIAGLRDEEALEWLDRNPEYSKLMELEADKLREIARVIQGEWGEGVADLAQMVILVDEREGDILAQAENDWFNFADRNTRA